MFKRSNNPKVEELTKSCKERSTNLDNLRAIKIELDGKTTRKCAWCAEGTLTHGNQKYCTTECSTSAMAWAYPQKEDALRYLLAAQDWKCKTCQYDYRPTITEIYKRDRDKYSDHGEVTDEELSKISWYYLKRLKYKIPKINKPEVDHVVPIYKGGHSLGLDNHQAICYSCHKAKTSKDLSGKRKVTDA